MTINFIYRCRVTGGSYDYRMSVAASSPEEARDKFIEWLLEGDNETKMKAAAYGKMHTPTRTKRDGQFVTVIV